MNDVIVTEYVVLCERLAALDAAAEQGVYARLDQLWYAEMTEIEHAEAERRLYARPIAQQLWHEDRRTEDP